MTSFGPDPERARLRKQYAAMSDRSFGDFYRARRRLALLVQEGQVTATQAREALVTFKNGKLNVSEFVRRVQALSAQSTNSTNVTEPPA